MNLVPIIRGMESKFNELVETITPDHIVLALFVGVPVLFTLLNLCGF